MINLEIKKVIPNFITLSNLFLGFVSIVLLALSFEDTSNYIATACYLILIAAILDSIDGKVARKLGISSDFGKEIDSLADLISFCLVPSMLLFVWSQSTESISLSKIQLIFLSSFPLIFGAIRLAKYNAMKEMRNSVKYVGLPTPANAIFISSSILYLFYHQSLDIPLFGALVAINHEGMPNFIKFMNYPLQYIYNTDNGGVVVVLLGIISSVLLLSKVNYDKFPLISFKINKRNSLDLIKMLFFVFILLASVYYGYYYITLLFFIFIYIFGNLIRYILSNLIIKMKELK